MRKMAHTRERDRRAVADARWAGWQGIRVWECEVNADPIGVALSILSRDSDPSLAR